MSICSICAGVSRVSAPPSAAVADCACASSCWKYAAPNSYTLVGWLRSTSRVNALSTEGKSFGTWKSLPYLETIAVTPTAARERQDLVRRNDTGRLAPGQPWFAPLPSLL